MIRWVAILTTTIGMALAGAASAEMKGEMTPTGLSITPQAATGSIFQPLNPDLADAPDFTAGQASALAVSPDGKTLLILTSGFNRMFNPDGTVNAADSSEYVFVYDITADAPVKRQVLRIPNAFLGMAWAPKGDHFFISGGVDDDVLEFVASSAGFTAARKFELHHAAGVGFDVKPEVAGLAVSPDGRRLLVANLQNDSVSLIDLATGAVAAERDLRPGKIDSSRTGQSGGTFPRAVAWVSNDKAYVTSQRDREVIALTIGEGAVRVGRRIVTRGQPVALLAGRAGRLYAALDNTDAVAAIDTSQERIIEETPTAAPAGMLRSGPALGGAGTNNLVMSPDGRTLLVTNGGENALAVIRLSDLARGARPTAKADADDAPAPKSAVVGLVPTGWYPTAVAVRPDGGRIYVINGKSNTGPAPANCRVNLRIDKDADSACKGANQYVWQREKAGFLTIAPPSAVELGALTRQVAANDHFPGSAAAAQGGETIAFLRQHIRHVIYIVKENRTYDQVLGDLEVGNGDPQLAVFPRAMTPNQHALARQFVDLDAFFDSGESSNTGWDWSTAARTNDFTEREAPVNYANRGLQYDQEGNNRNLNMGLADSAARRAINPTGPADPDLLAGARDVAAPDGPDGAEGQGYIWDAARRAKISLRNWGFFGDLRRYDGKAREARIPLVREPWKTGTTVFYTSKIALMGVTDPYYRGFDQAFPDYWRFKEWEREFDGFAATGQAPSLMLVRLAHDHTGNFAEGIDGVNTVETEIADNDYAVGLLIQKVARSPFAKDTLIFVIEDDAQDGPDHVDAHRSIAFVAGPYVKRGAVVSHRYNTVNMVRTIEEVLGLQPTGLNDAMAEPMSEVFDPGVADWTFEARVPIVLRTTGLPLPPATTAQAACPAPRQRSTAYWQAAMAGQDFSQEDRLNTATYNAALWRGLKGAMPYPTARDGRDLRNGRPANLAASPIACE